MLSHLWVYWEASKFNISSYGLSVEKERNDRDHFCWGMQSSSRRLFISLQEKLGALFLYNVKVTLGWRAHVGETIFPFYWHRFKEQLMSFNDLFKQNIYWNTHPVFPSYVLITKRSRWINQGAMTSYVNFIFEYLFYGAMYMYLFVCVNWDGQ